MAVTQAGTPTQGGAAGATTPAIVEATGIDRSTVAEMIPRMLEHGWLQRRRAREDTHLRRAPHPLRQEALTAADLPAARARKPFSAVRSVRRDQFRSPISATIPHTAEFLAITLRPSR